MQRVEKRPHRRGGFPERGMEVVVCQLRCGLLRIVQQFSINIVDGSLQSHQFPEAAAVDAADAVGGKPAHLFFRELRRMLWSDARQRVIAPVIDIDRKSLRDFDSAPFLKFLFGIAAEFNHHVVRKFTETFRRIACRGIADDQYFFAGTVLEQTFRQGTVQYPEFFTGVVCIAVGFAGFALAGLVAVGLGKFHGFCSGVQSFQHFSIDQILNFRIGNAQMISAGDPFSAQEREIFRMTFAVFSRRNRRVVGMPAVNSITAAPIVVVGIVIHERLSAAGGKIQERIAAAL